METVDRHGGHGLIIQRERLLGVFRAQRFALTLLCAPAGYGKSVLAAQFCQSREFDAVYWVSGLDEDMNDDRLLTTLAARLSADTASESRVDGSPVATRTDALLVIGDELKERRGQSICVVVDACRRLECPRALADISNLVQKYASTSSALLVACRSLASVEGFLQLRQPWVLDEKDLRFTLDEVRELDAACGSASSTRISQILRRFGGHPALTSLMLRHVNLDNEESPPRDLVWYVRRMTAGLSRATLEFLYVASLLQDDTTYSLGACAASWPEDAEWDELASLSPLVAMPRRRSEVERFRLHAVLRDEVFRLARARLEEGLMLRARDRVIRYLCGVMDYGRLQGILLSESTEPEIVRWCEQYGQMILRRLGPTSTTELLEVLSPEVVAGDAQLMLLRAQTLYEQERAEESKASASLAAAIAEAEGNLAVTSTALLHTVRCCIDLDDLAGARVALESLDDKRQALDPTLRLMVEGYSAMVESCLGHDLQAAEPRAAVLEESLSTVDDLGSMPGVSIINSIATVKGMGAGRWAEAARLMGLLVSRDDLYPSARLTARANLAACYVELGLLGEATTLLDGVIEDGENANRLNFAAFAYGTRSTARHANGDVEAGVSDFDRCRHLMHSLGHEGVLLCELLNAAVSMRAVCRKDEALVLVEQARQLLLEGVPLYMTPSQLVDLEMAASLLSFDDVWSAMRIAQEARAALEGTGRTQHLLRADLIMSEIDRVQGKNGYGYRLKEYSEYIVTGSANWICALYIRAFPGLLGLLAKAIGADNIPLRMLLMIPPETMDVGLEMAKDYLDDEEAAILRRRRGTEALTAVEQAAPSPSHSCYVRLFGGLEVITEAGVVEDAMWRKRKARLLFVILVLRQHQDVPRDVLLERLWPEMDEEHAKRNFYVTWSTMKRALACGDSPSAAKQFVQVSGGVCRATKQVRSDLDDFDEALSALRAAVSQGEAAVARMQARRLIELYRGELLPGDLYEEWLSEIRDRAKHDFCDAMMLAAAMAEGNDDAEESLLYLRKAAVADPWREDVYQSMMRCQMNSGQRSRAIETYLNCRSRLTEDLGIDPSTETTKLYQAVLAMEEAVVE